MYRCEADVFAPAEGSIWRRPLKRSRADSPGSLAQGMLHRDGQEPKRAPHLLSHQEDRLWKKRGSLEHVAMLLADSPEIVRDHYYPWFPALQKELERAVQIAKLNYQVAYRGSPVRSTLQ